MTPEQDLEDSGGQPADGPIRWRPSFAAMMLLAALLLLPRLHSFGLWDPQEIRTLDVAKEVASARWLTVSERNARTPLPVIVVALGLRTIGLTELGGRVPIVVCALLTLAALFLLARCLWGPDRLAVPLSLLALLTMPTFFLGARQVTTHLLPVLGQVLAVFGLCAAVWPRPPGQGALPGERWLGVLSAGLGLAIGFFSIGAPLGLAAPLLAVAVALQLATRGGQEMPIALLSAGGALSLVPPVRLVVAQMMLVQGSQVPGGGTQLSRVRVGVAVAMAVCGAAWLVLGRRGRLRGGASAGIFLLVLGLGLVSHLKAYQGGYSPWVGGYLHWPPTRDFQVDSVLKPLGFQLFPWSALLPLGLIALLHTGGRREAGGADAEARQWFAGLVPLSWFALTYVLCTYQGALSAEVPFPALGAMALAAGLYLSRVLRGEAGGPFQGLCVALLAVLIGHDLFLFPEQVGGAHFIDPLHWPAPLTYIPGILCGGAIVLGVLLGLGLALDPAAYPRARRGLLLSTLGLILVATVGVIQGIVPAISQHVSYRGIYTKYKMLGGGDLGVYAVARSGSKFYGQNSVDLTSIQGVFDFLNRDAKNRAFVMAGAQELAALDQLAKQRGYTYHVVDDSNVQFLLLSNQLGKDESDLNPLRRLVLSREPTPQHVARATFDGKIELLGYDMPDEVSRGQDFVIRLYFKVVQPIGAGYKIFLHFDGSGARWNGDHVPLDGKFPTMYWVPGYYVIDEHHMSSSRMEQSAGIYQILTGFWPGGNGARLPVSSGPQDGDNRVRLGVVRVK